MRAEFGGWQFALLSSDIELLDQLRLPYEQHLKVFNGPLSCYFRCGKVGQADAQLVESQRYAEFIQSVFNTTSFVPTDRVSSDLANRVIKNLKKLKKWALAEDTQCFRIYDADLPEFNFSIDIYGRYLHIQEYAAPKSIPEQVAQQRLDMGVETVSKLFDLASKEMFVKTKRRQRGNTQYQKLSNQGKYYEIEEYGARILVNLSDYVDTGIFLDHRLVRKKIASLVEGKRFLNLFAYTGTATVSAALAGAKTSTTVDLSPTYIKWARKNMALNGFAEDNHYFVQQDCLTWLKKSKKQFDVIFIDPPTFSNSKRTQNVFNVQKDHVEILRLALARLEAGGIIVFSNNFRKFELDPDVHGMYQVEDITRQSIPQDFSRRPRIHQCWLLTRK